MEDSRNKNFSILLADRIAQLFSICQEKEAKIVQDSGVSIVEYRCLRILSETEQLTPKQLALKMGLTSSRITRIIDGLVEKEIVLRESGHQDRRIYHLSLTSKGKNIADQLNNKYKVMHEEILKSIPKEYHSTLLTGVERLYQAIKKYLDSS